MRKPVTLVTIRDTWIRQVKNDKGGVQMEAYTSIPNEELDYALLTIKKRNALALWLHLMKHREGFNNVETIDDICKAIGASYESYNQSVIYLEELGFLTREGNVIKVRGLRKEQT